MAQSVIQEASKYVGVVKGSSKHRRIIDGYNRQRPLPMGYHVTYQDDWCDIFVTYIADQVGAATYTGRECGVARHVQIFKQLGIWLGRHRPQLGDILVFDWDGNGWGDHIGYVAQVQGEVVTTIEGNSSNQVARRQYLWDDKRIMGFARPKYPNQPNELATAVNTRSASTCQCSIDSAMEQVVQEVIRGQWGSGQERVRRLQAAGWEAEAVQTRVNQRLQG